MRARICEPGAMLARSYMAKVLRVGEAVLPLKFNDPGLARRFWNRVIRKQIWFDENKEHVVVLLLSVQLDVEGYSLVSIGNA